MREFYIPDNQKRSVIHYRDENGDVWIRKQKMSYIAISRLVDEIELDQCQYDTRKRLERWLSDYGIDVEKAEDSK